MGNPQYGSNKRNGRSGQSQFEYILVHQLSANRAKIRLIWTVLREGSSSRKIFTERLPELLDPSSRLTSRLRKTIQEIGLATCGICPKLGIALSDTTLLWSLHLISIRIASREILPVGMNFVSLISSSVGGCHVFELSVSCKRGKKRKKRRS
jgi:hypothetical protein